jgi:hypothetical protein
LGRVQEASRALTPEADVVKKALQIVTTIGLLVAGYAGYVRGFATLAAQVQRPRLVPLVNAGVNRAKSALQADELARRAFGADHWSADPNPEKSFRYYDRDRHYWIYSKNYTRSRDGKRLRLWPVAVILESKEGRSLKTMTGDEAFVDFEQPLDMGKGGGGANRVVHARIDGHVVIRDDKGTPSPVDDLTIGPEPYFEYDGKQHLILTESPIVLKDRDTTVTGVGARIELRLREGLAPGQGGGLTGGYTGAKTIHLLRNVHILVKDVGRSGIVPGADAGAPGARKVAQGPRPGDIQCDGEMRLDLPRPRLKPPCGPPAASEPTFAHFSRNTKVRQGDPEQPDQIDCDQLHLILIPNEDLPTTPEVLATQLAAKAKAKAEAEADAAASGKAPDAAAPDAAPADAPASEEGALSGLALIYAEGLGHAVWLQSPTQGTKALGNQLIYNRYAPLAPDRIYFRGDKYTDIWKTNYVAEGKDKGKVQSIDRIRAVDVTIFQVGQGQSRVIARGPGELQTRPSSDKPVERSATWRDQLEMQTVLQGGQPRRRVTLFGDPHVKSLTQGDIQAREWIIAYLKPKPKPEPKPEDKGKDDDKDGTPAESAEAEKSGQLAASGPGAGDAMRIERFEAKGDVHMVSVQAPGEPSDNPEDTPTSQKVVDARQTLVAYFEDPPAAPKPQAKAASAADAPATPAAPAAVVAQATPATQAEAKPKSEAEAEDSKPKPSKPPEPNMEARADAVWARIVHRPDSEKGELKQVWLRGDVSIHQDPAPDKPRGTDVTGNAVDVVMLEPGKAQIWAQGNPAIVVTDDKTIEGLKLSLNQVTDYAEVTSPGRLIQAAASPAPDGIQPASFEEGKAQGGSRSQTVEITWEGQMRFFGRPVDRAGRPAPARAEFYRGVRARTVDSSVACEDRMIAYMDRQVAFTRPPRDPDDPRPPAPEPKPEIVTVHCFKAVEVVNRKLDPASKLLQEKQRVLGDDVVFHRPTGDFRVYGPGTVYYYDRGKPKDQPQAPKATAGATTDQPPARVATVARSGSDAGATTRLKPSADARTKGSVSAKSAKGPTKPAKPPAPPLELTRIRFEQGMDGKAPGVQLDEKEGDKGKDKKKPTPKEAHFSGDVQVMRAEVADDEADLDPDRPPAQYMLMTSRRLDVASEPAPPDSKATSRTLLKARGDAHVNTEDRAIQGDRIHHDSLDDVFWIYGDENEVRIAQQAGVGQPSSHGQGSIVEYNHKNGAMKVRDPRNFLFVDPKTAIRATPMAPEPEKEEKKKPRKIVRPPTNSDKERRGFSGR